MRERDGDREKNQNFLSKITEGTFDLEFIDSFLNCRLSNNNETRATKKKSISSVIVMSAVCR